MQQTPDAVLVVDDPSITGPRGLERWAQNRSVRCARRIDVEVHPDAFVRNRKAFADDEGLTAVFGSYHDDPERHGLVSDFRNLLPIRTPRRERASRPRSGPVSAPCVAMQV